MKRIKDEFISKLESWVLLAGKIVLEIGCGDGARSEELAQRCKYLVGIDPSGEQIALAMKKKIRNASFQQQWAESLIFKSESFDMVVYTLSFHHLQPQLMSQAISQAIRIVKRNGLVVFLEPGTEGSLFDAEIDFDAFDGDERRQKSDAYAAMMKHPDLCPVAEIADESVFQFDSLEDFMESMKPKNNLDAIEPFLQEHDYILRAERRINIFQPK